MTRSELQDYYAVNAPIPGHVGVASARVTRPPSDIPPAPLQYLASSSASADNCDPLEPGKMGLTDSRVYNPDATPPSHYTAPPPQPARSYTPTSKAVMRMGAPQPLYSNTNRSAQQVKQQMHHHVPTDQRTQQLYQGALQQHQMSQPLYSNQHGQQQHQAVYSNVPRSAVTTEAPSMQQSQQLYANVTPRNGELQ